MPPRVCWATTKPVHSTKTATIDRSREKAGETLRIDCLTFDSLKIEISPALSVEEDEKPGVKEGTVVG
jgi:hypothetical protein